MKFRSSKMAFVLSGLLVFVGIVGASETIAPAKAEKKPYEVGDTVKPFTLKDASGKEHDLGDVLGKKVVVLDFWSCACPVSRAYEERLKDIQKKYADKVVVIAIDSNKINDEETIKKYAKQHELNYPVLKDWGNKVADRFGARVTPETFVICKGKKIRYHGAIDDSQNPNNIKNHYLAAALDAVLAGKEVEEKETKAFGCTIKRVN